MHVVIYLSKLREYNTKSEPSGSMVSMVVSIHGLYSWSLGDIMFLCRFISCNKYTSLVNEADHRGVGALWRKISGTSNHFFFFNLNLL